MNRDFTYIDDLVQAVTLLIDKVPKSGHSTGAAADSVSSVASFRVVNIGNSQPTKLMDFVYAVEKAIGKKRQKLITCQCRLVMWFPHGQTVVHYKI